MSDPASMLLVLATVPQGSKARSVEVATADKVGRTALSVTFDERTARGTPNIDYIDMPTFLELPIEFENGEISVDILGELRADAPDYARAFAGVAYRITEIGFEAVYLRPLNGLRLEPHPPRSRRAVQYFSYPDWRFERLREEYPDGRYEAGADIRPGEWIELTLRIQDEHVAADVNGETVLEITKAKSPPSAGRIGLFVDIGTQAYFSNLRISS